MPRFTTPTGQVVYIPGVYSKTIVRSDLPGPLPQFHVPVIVGDADEASYPFNFDSVKVEQEDERHPFVSLGTTGAVGEEYGPDSDLAVATAFAKRHGMPWSYYIAGNALTRATVPAHSAGPIVQGSIYARKFGAIGGHIQLAVVGGTTVTITPPKRYSRLTADALTGATRLYVKASDWLAPGDVIHVGDNNTANAQKTVASVGSELTSTGQVRYYVEITAALAADLTTAQYGLILQYDTQAQETPAAFSTVQEMMDWFNDESEYLGFQKASATFTNPASLIALATATPLKEIAAWGVAVPGTSPAGTSGNHTTLIASLDSTDWDRFALDQQVIPRAFLVLSSSDTVHGLWRDWAIAKRTLGESVSIDMGCAWGDVSTTANDDTNPRVRAGTLDCDSVSLWAGGLNKIASYLSLAAATFGLRVGRGLRHNLTNDDLLYDSVERVWDERGAGELTYLHRGGVGTYRLSTAGGSIRYRVSQGLTTRQLNASAWNESDATTPLIMQRDLADFIDRVMREEFDGTQVGADEVTRESVAAVAVRKLQQLKRRGYITSYTITGIELDATGAGWNVTYSVRLPVTNDYMGLTTTILIGE